MKEVFEKIYANNEWGFGSGEGSLSKNTKEYVAFLEGFLRSNNITSVVDAGCGDWQFSKFIDWHDVEYSGFDIVESVVDTNKSKFSTKNIDFTLYDGNPDKLPDADLLIVKDVLQHLSHSNIVKFIENFKKYKYCLITNCVNPHGSTINLDIFNGDFSFLDLRLEPFNIKADKVLSFKNHTPFYIPSFVLKTRWLKKVLLITNKKTV